MDRERRPLVPRCGFHCDFAAVRSNGCSHELLRLPSRTAVRRLSALRSVPGRHGARDEKGNFGLAPAECTRSEGAARRGQVWAQSGRSASRLRTAQYRDASAERSALIKG